VGNILDNIYEQLKSIDREQLKASSILVSGAVSAAILLRAVKDFVRFVGVMFVALSLSLSVCDAVLDTLHLTDSFWRLVITWAISFSSYPIAKGFMDLLQAVIAIVSERIKDFFKTYTPGFMGWFNKKKDNDTV
jgi:hypothetical protein